MERNQRRLNNQIYYIQGLVGSTSKTSISPKLIRFVDVEKLILKFLWRGKDPKIAKRVLKKKNKMGGIIPPDFKVTVIKIMQYWKRDSIQINGTQQRIQKQTNMPKCFLTKVQKQFNVGAILFSTNGAVAIVHPQVITNRTSPKPSNLQKI